MDTIGFIISVIVANLGIVVGIILHYVALEEVKPGLQYFILMKNIILVMVLAFVLHLYAINLGIIFLAIVIIGAILYYLDYYKARMHAEFWMRLVTYLFLGLAISYAMKNDAYFLSIASLIFLYGLPVGTLAVIKENKWKVILSSLGFLVSPIIVLLI